jgi:hypothetical protein
VLVVSYIGGYNVFGVAQEDERGVAVETVAVVLFESFVFAYLEGIGKSREDSHVHDVGFGDEVVEKTRLGSDC